MEDVYEIQLFSVNMGTLDEQAQKFLKMKRQRAELQLLKQMQTEEPVRREFVPVPSAHMEEDIEGPNITLDGPRSTAFCNEDGDEDDVDDNEDVEELPGDAHTQGDSVPSDSETARQSQGHPWAKSTYPGNDI